MANPLERLGQHVSIRLRKLGHSSPNRYVVQELLDRAYLATLRTEEARFVRGSVTFADPEAPDLDPPLLRRLDYPAFTRFGHRVRLTVETLVKLSRAIDNWSGSIAVYGTSRSNIVAWGVIDQLVHRSVRLHGEGQRGFRHLGILSVVMDGVGALSVYHGDLFIGGLKQDQLILRENDTLRSPQVAKRVLPFLKPIVRLIRNTTSSSLTRSEVQQNLLEVWSTTLVRICIGLRRVGTGGALLITPKPVPHLLDVPHPFNYARLGHSALLSVLDAAYLLEKNDERDDEVWFDDGDGLVPAEWVREQSLAESDAEDRENELTGAVRLVSSLAAVDGLVLLTPLLEVVGFGVKILSGSQVGTVYEGPSFMRRRTAAAVVDTSRFGTRHNSMLRYCRKDRDALGIVVSQDGQVRVTVSIGRSLTMWDNTKLLRHESDLPAYAQSEQTLRAYRMKWSGEAQKLGYTTMPKTLEALERRGPSVKT